MTKLGVESEEKAVEEIAKDVSLSTHETWKLSSTPNSIHNLDILFGGEFDFGFDFGAVLDEAVSCSTSLSSSATAAIFDLVAA